jgi:cytochrome P450
MTKVDVILRYGYGRQACPGRFYGVRKAKLIFGRLLKDYDFRWKGGEQRTERPANIVVEGQIFANNTVEVDFRSRHVERA